MFLLPFSLIAVLLILAIAAPQTLPRKKWFPSLSNIANSTSSSSSSSSSNTTETPLVQQQQQQHVLAAAPATVTAPDSPSDQRARLLTRPVGRRLQAAAAQPDNSPTTPHTETEEDAASSSSRATDLVEDDEQTEQLTTPGVAEANLAYFIQLSETTLAHLPRLLSRIYHPKNVYVIHFDKKVEPKVTKRIRTNLYKRNPQYKENVMYMSSELITYRGVSMLLNTINAMRELLRFNADWDYFINISGADYPLVSQNTIRQMLGRHLETPLNFMSYAPVEKWQENLGFRMDHIYIDEALSFQRDGGVVQQLPVLNPLARSMKLQYANAEAWMINSRELCQFVVTSGYARKMLLTFAYSVESSEHYFATLIWNHQAFNRTIVGHAMREVIWHHEGQHAGQHPFYVDDKNPDGSFKFKKRLATAPTFFIRKFKKAESPMMDFLDGRWENEAHLKGVREKLDWHIGMSMDEHALKPPLKDADVEG